MSWLRGVQCQKGSYTITLLGDGRDLLTSQTMLITISISVVSMMQNTFGIYAVAILVTSWQCDEQAIHMVHCTGSPRWRTYKAPRNNTVLFWIGTSLDSHFKSTAGRIPAWLMCLFFVEEAELSIKALVAFIQMFATWPICQTAGMAIVDERHQPAMRHLHNGSYCGKPHFGVGTTDIVPICGIYRAVHLLPLMPQLYRIRWYMSNTIDLYAFHLIYMLMIWFDAWSNRCSDILNSEECFLWIFVMGVVQASV